MRGFIEKESDKSFSNLSLKKLRTSTPRRQNQDEISPFSLKYRSASIAARQPVPAAVTA